MKKTFEQLKEVDVLVGGLYQKNPTLRASKFGYAYKRFTDKNYSPLLDKFNEELENIRVEYALEHPDTKEILLDPSPANRRGYKYSKEGMVGLLNAERKLVEKWQAKEVEIEPYLSPMVPEGLEDEQKELLKGLVLK